MGPSPERLHYTARALVECESGGRGYMGWGHALHAWGPATNTPRTTRLKSQPADKQHG